MKNSLSEPSAQVMISVGSASHTTPAVPATKDPRFDQAYHFLLSTPDLDEIKLKVGNSARDGGRVTEEVFFFSNIRGSQKLTQQFS